MLIIPLPCSSPQLPPPLISQHRGVDPVTLPQACSRGLGLGEICEGFLGLSGCEAERGEGQPLEAEGRAHAKALS